jgi:hypothetical protein
MSVGIILLNFDAFSRHCVDLWQRPALASGRYVSNLRLPCVVANRIAIDISCRNKHDQYSAIVDLLRWNQVTNIGSRPGRGTDAIIAGRRPSLFLREVRDSLPRLSFQRIYGI